VNRCDQWLLWLLRFYSLATHLQERGKDIRAIKALLGRSDGRTAVIYRYALNKVLYGIISLADSLLHGEHYFGWIGYLRRVR
jgi:hypothetical protein